MPSGLAANELMFDHAAKAATISAGCRNGSGFQRRAFQAACSQDVSSIRPKAVVDAELHGLDSLLDINPWHHFGHTSNRAGQ